MTDQTQLITRPPALSISHVADRAWCYPGETITLHTRIETRIDLSGLSVRVSVPRGFQLGQTDGELLVLNDERFVRWTIATAVAGARLDVELPLIAAPTPEDMTVDLKSELAHYALLYLVGHGAFQLAPDEMNAIYAYLQAGGTVLYESCRHEADAAFLDLLSSLGQKIDDLPRGHALLNEPHFFAQPPAGYEANAQSSIKLSSHVIVSGGDYGCVWQGERRSGPADRADIRSALEFGENVVTYAVERKV